MSCEYCRESNDNTPIADVRAPGVSAYAVISEEGELAITSVTREINVSASPINYCPMCGRDLRGGGSDGE